MSEKRQKKALKIKAKRIKKANSKRNKKANKKVVLREDLGNYFKESNFFENNKEGVLLDVINGEFDETVPGAVISASERDIEISIMSNCEGRRFLGTIRFEGTSFDEIKANLKNNGLKGKRVRFIGLHETHKVMFESYTVINAIFEDVDFNEGHLWFGCGYFFIGAELSENEHLIRKLSEAGIKTIVARA